MIIFRSFIFYLSILCFPGLCAFASQSAHAEQWSGDLRVRGQVEKNGDDEARTNTKLRARFGVRADISPELKAEIRLATTKSNRSTNQTLGDNSEPGSRRRYIGLDLGYVLWNPVDFFKLYAGRIPQLHYRPGASQILLDEDLSLEGAGFVSDYEFRPDWRVFLSGGSSYLRENYDTYYSQDLTDYKLNFAQLGFAFNNQQWKITWGAGFFNFTSVKGGKFSDLVSGGQAYGNTPGDPGYIKYAYLPRQYFADLSYKLAKSEIGIFSERIDNPEASGNNSASWTGLSFSLAQIDAQLAYCQVQRDAVLGAFTFSDFAAGTTDSQGWVGHIRWKFAKNLNLKLTQFVNRSAASSLNKEYHRTHIDLSATF